MPGALQLRCTAASSFPQRCHTANTANKQHTWPQQLVEWRLVLPSAPRPHNRARGHLQAAAEGCASGACYAALGVERTH